MQALRTVVAVSAFIANEAGAVLMQKITLRVTARAVDSCPLLPKAKGAAGTEFAVPSDPNSCDAWCKAAPANFMDDDSKPCVSDASNPAFTAGKANPGTLVTGWHATDESCQCDDKVVCKKVAPEDSPTCDDKIVKAKDEAAAKDECNTLCKGYNGGDFQKADSSKEGHCKCKNKPANKPSCTIPKSEGDNDRAACPKPDEMDEAECKKWCTKDLFKSMEKATAEKGGLCLCTKAKEEGKPETDGCTVPKGTEVKSKDKDSSSS